MSVQGPTRRVLGLREASNANIDETSRRHLAQREAEFDVLDSEFSTLEKLSVSTHAPKGSWPRRTTHEMPMGREGGRWEKDGDSPPELATTKSCLRFATRSW